MAAEEDERQEELDTLTAIFPELLVDSDDPFSASLELPVRPTTPLLVRFVPTSRDENGSYADIATHAAAYVERDVELSYLPPLSLRATLPQGYPEDAPPAVHLSTRLNWLPKEKISELENEAANLWAEYGRCQILYSYIDHLQQAAERAFDLQQSAEGCLVLKSAQESQLIRFDAQTRQEVFEAGTYDCGVCLERKKGSECYRMSHCGHIFCKQCLQDFYNNAIKEGDVAGVRCMDPTCGEETDASGRKKKRRERPVHPRELLAMGIEEAVARRYVEMKRKKLVETDKNTVYCPRTWCQGPAKSPKYPPIPADLTTYTDPQLLDDEADATRNVVDSPHEQEKKGPAVPDPNDRLAICEKCSLAFCKVCYAGWHGPFARCYPRDPNELSAEEKASYEYIRKSTSPCPNCYAPIQKTMGCNHMRCFLCKHHLCYLCGAWLDGDNPYQHFNKPGTPCYQRLWELEEGDEGQAPGDGRGFAGGARGWEQMAVEVARQADEAEAEAAAAVAQAEEDGRAANLPAAPEPPNHQPPVVVAMAHLQMQDEGNGDLAPPLEVPRRNGRRPRNPFPAHPPGRGAAQAVRHHERVRAGGGWRRPLGPVLNVADGQGDLQDREQADLQRFLELARNDEEDGWDSDELGDDDDFVIPNR